MSFDDYVNQPKPEQKIWRYMDFTKFISLLHRRALFFVQVKHLDDKWEGYVEAPVGSDLENALREMRIQPNSWHSYILVSCWHMNDCESAAMWQQYAAQNAGIAIQTRVSKLIKSLDLDLSSFWQFRTGAINYNRLQVRSGPEGAGVDVLYFHKLESFKHENEYRVMGFARDMVLANKVYISPKAPSWFATLVESIAKEKYGVRCDFEQSVLGKDPLA
jgi:hypothetical protein